MSAEDYATLKATVETFAFLQQELKAKGASVERLRQIVFGSKTEKTSQVFGNKGAPASPEGGPDESKAKPRTKKPGHGRNGAAAYTGAKKVKVAHPALHRVLPASVRRGRTGFRRGHREPSGRAPPPGHRGAHLGADRRGQTPPLERVTGRDVDLTQTAAADTGLKPTMAHVRFSRSRSFGKWGAVVMPLLSAADLISRAIGPRCRGSSTASSRRASCRLPGGDAGARRGSRTAPPCSARRCG